MRITEESLEQEVATSLSKLLKAEIITQVRSGSKKPDVILIMGKIRYVLELEIGGSRKMIEAIAQANDYKNELQADGIIGIVYPNEVRREIESQHDLIEIAESYLISVLVLAPNISRSYSNIRLTDFITQFKNLTIQRTPQFDVELLVTVLREAVNILSLQIRKSQNVSKPTLDSVITSFDLFAALTIEAEKPSSDTPRDLVAAACDLTAYVLVNQMLLYQLLRGHLSLPELDAVQTMRELQQAFKLVTNVDYRAVYNADVTGDLPQASLRQINKIIVALRILQSEKFPHDLIGRIFHEFLPDETRKQLATFYTKPVAAEILAGLVVNTGREKVIDPACGSGTLLVGAYRAKRRRNPRTTHKKIVENEIFGIDIMPFAAHLASLNLTLQDLPEITDKLNIGVGNSLSFSPGAEIHTQLPLLPKLMHTMDVDIGLTKVDFDLPNDFDIVIMNPPFTDMRRLGPSMLGGYAKSYPTLQNYWAYFLNLADNLLVKNGQIGAILPRLLFSGYKSQEVRKAFFKDGKFDLKYVIRTSKEVAFSEAALFRDFIIVLEKGGKDSLCGVVYLKNELKSYSIQEATELSDRIKQVTPGRNYDDEELQVVWLSQNVVRQNWKNLYPLFGFENANNAKIITDFFDSLTSLRGKSLVTLDEERNVKTMRGFEPRPNGLYDAIFIVNPINKSRIERAKLVLEDKDDGDLIATNRVSGLKIRVPDLDVIDGLKTPYYLNTQNVKDSVDKVIVKRYRRYKNDVEGILDINVGFEYVQDFSNERLSHMLAVKRIDLNSPGASALAFYNPNKMVSTNVFYSVVTSDEYSKLLTLWLNSSVGFLQVLMLRNETRGSYCDILLSTLREEILFPNKSIGEKNRTKINQLMKKFGSEPMPSLFDEFKNPSKARKELDAELLLMVGWRKEDIDRNLGKLYKAIASEMELINISMTGDKPESQEDTLL